MLKAVTPCDAWCSLKVLNATNAALRWQEIILMMIEPMLTAMGSQPLTMQAMEGARVGCDDGEDWWGQVTAALLSMMMNENWSKRLSEKWIFLIVWTRKSDDFCCDFWIEFAFESKSHWEKALRLCILALTLRWCMHVELMSFPMVGASEFTVQQCTQELHTRGITASTWPLTHLIKHATINWHGSVAHDALPIVWHAWSDSLVCELCTHTVHWPQLCTDWKHWHCTDCTNQLHQLAWTGCVSSCGALAVPIAWSGCTGLCTMHNVQWTLWLQWLDSVFPVCVFQILHWHQPQGSECPISWLHSSEQLIALLNSPDWVGAREMTTLCNALAQMASVDFFEKWNLNSHHSMLLRRGQGGGWCTWMIHVVQIWLHMAWKCMQVSLFANSFFALFDPPMGTFWEPFCQEMQQHTLVLLPVSRNPTCTTNVHLPSFLSICWGRCPSARYFASSFWRIGFEAKQQSMAQSEDISCPEPTCRASSNESTWCQKVCEMCMATLVLDQNFALNPLTACKCAESQPFQCISWLQLALFCSLVVFSFKMWQQFVKGTLDNKSSLC